jgi:hypothetical protein
MEHHWGSCRACRFKKQQSPCLGVTLGHSLGAQNSSLDLNSTWDEMSLGLVQGLALQKTTEPRAWSGTWTQLWRTKQQIGLEHDLGWDIDGACAGPGASKNN